MKENVSSLWAIKGKTACSFFSADLLADASAHDRPTQNSFSPSKLINSTKLPLGRKGWDCPC